MNQRFIFNELCHLAAISKEGLTSEVVHNLVLTALVVENSDGEVTKQRVSKLVYKVFGIELNPSALESAIDMLVNKGHLHRTKGKNHITIDKETKTKISKNIIDAKSIEETIRDEFINSAGYLIKNKRDGWEDDLWNALRYFLSLAFMRHGVQTLSLLDSSFSPDDEQNGLLSTFVNDSINKFCKGMDIEECRSAFNLFFETSDEIKELYLSQILDGVFNCYALSLDKKTLAHLKRKIKNLAVYLDSNIIFGLLDLSDDYDNRISKELLELPKRHRLPFKFLCHPETILELERYFHNVRERLNGKSWSQEISKAAVKIGDLSGAELKFHELNSRSKTDVGVFFTQFEHIEALLEEWGVEIATPSAFTAEEDFSRHEMVAQYDEYLKENRSQGSKPYKSCDHDVILWKTVERGIKSSKTIVDNDSVILTKDYHLFIFARKHLRRPGVVAPIVLPDIFLQLIGIFTSSAADINKGLIETFIRPAFRTLKDDYASTKAKVISYLNTYKDVSEATAVKLLTDEILMNSLRAVERDTEEFHRKIESALISNVQKLTQQLDEAKTGIESANVKLDALENENEKLSLKSKAMESEVNSLIGKSFTQKKDYETKIKILLNMVYIGPVRDFV